MGLPVLVSEAEPIQPLLEQDWVWAADPQGLSRQLRELLSDEVALQAQGERARLGFLQYLASPSVVEVLLSAAHSALNSPTPPNEGMVQPLDGMGPSYFSPFITRQSLLQGLLGSNSHAPRASKWASLV